MRRFIDVIIHNKRAIALIVFIYIISAHLVASNFLFS